MSSAQRHEARRDEVVHVLDAAAQVLFAIVPWTEKPNGRKIQIFVNQIEKQEASRFLILVILVIAAKSFPKKPASSKMVASCDTGRC